MVQATPPRSFEAGTPVEGSVSFGASAGAQALRIYYVPLSMLSGAGDWPAVLDACAGMGFDTVLISPPTDPGPGGNLLLPYDLDRPHPALAEHAHGLDDAVARLAEACRSRSLQLMVDMVPDRIAAGGPLASQFRVQPAGRGARDPRIAPAERSSAHAPLDDSEQAQAYIDTYASFVGRLVGAGATGFRWLAPDRVGPAAWNAWRGAGGKSRFLAWTPGLSREACAALAGQGFDGCFSSLRWWDCREGWPVDERDRLRAIGPAIAFPEAPFDARLAEPLASEDVTRRRSERALWIAATLGEGLMVPMGFEFGARERVPRAGAPSETYAALKGRPPVDLGATIREANQAVSRRPHSAADTELRLLAGGGAPVTALAEMPLGTRGARSVTLILLNPSLDRGNAVEGAALAPEIGAYFPLRQLWSAGPNLAAESTVSLRPGEVRVYEGEANRAILMSQEQLGLDERKAVAAPRLIIETVTPAVDGGAFPVKRIVGEVVRIEADAFAEGHDQIAVALRWRAADEEAWRERRMRSLGNDRWAADLPLERLGRYAFTIEAWRDEFTIYLYELTKKHEAGLNVGLELEEGRRLVERISQTGAEDTRERVSSLLERLNGADDPTRLSILTAPDTTELMKAADPRPFRLTSAAYPIDAERTAAGFASWYELFPRSMSDDVNRHGTFDDVIGRLPYVKAMNFDVLYFPPIHPIGRINRKGRNNTLTAGPEDPGSPYAIGAAEGGHDAIHPELGDFEAFERLRQAAAAHGLELALDFAIQASPDHPWLKQHPEWFDWRPDGSIRYAENPPKKYEDIVNVDFYKEGAKPSLWVTLRDTLLFWVDKGVKLFRIDNPHTKPFPFWEWCIAEVRREHPDVVFLAEAFTRPKVMYRLAKIGYSQSYTYFTWRNTKSELTDYLVELTTTAPKDFFRPHFFVNTPDINPDFLQDAPRSAFLIRAALATTLSGLWGMYSGFELCEGRPDAKKKEYADSEKYQLTAWDWDRPGNIIGEIGQLNRIRRDNPALHSHLGVTFRGAYNDNILLFTKSTPTRDNVLMVAISLDPHRPQEADIELPLWEFGEPDHGSIPVEDLMRGHRFAWTGKYQRIRLDPGEVPFSIWRLGGARGA
jgi:starch synthase (maltosyl-transferring)